MAADDVQLPDLEVIQRYSLAVRGASAPRADVIAALQADLDWLTSGGGRPAKAAPQGAATRTPTKTPKAPAKAAAKSPTAPKRAPRRAPAKRTSSTPAPTSEA